VNSMVQIDKLQKQFGKKEVLHQFTLTLENKNYWLLGANGSGKTTLFRIIVGLEKSNGGSITADKGEKKLRIGYLPQKFGAFPYLTVEEQLCYFARLKTQKNDGIDWTTEVDSAIKLVHLEEQRKQKCKALSGGMVRRLGIAQAIIGRPDLILLDEPTVGLDIEERMRFQKILENIRGQQPVLVSTHVLDDISPDDDEIVIINHQQVAFHGSAAEIANFSKSSPPTLQGGYLQILERDRHE
jgi:ABC-2 type transport system ATP-binding protein